VDTPSNRVTRGRVLVLAAITFVALAYGSFRWSPDDGPPAALPVVAATGAGTAQSTPPPGRGASLVPGGAGSPDTTTLAAAEALLGCLRTNESRGEYAAVSPSGSFFGAYQFDQQTWNNTANHAGRPGLAGVQPNLAAPAEQDQMALALLQWQGTAPWNGDPCVS
jgi:hypothetical protein